MQLNTSQPQIYLSIQSLWPGTSLVVLALKQLPGQAQPTATFLASFTSNTTSTQPITVPVTQDKASFDCAALRFAVTTLPSHTGKVVIGVMREQDTRTTPPFGRDIKETIELERSSTYAPLYIQADLSLTPHEPPAVSSGGGSNG